MKRSSSCSAHENGWRCRGLGYRLRGNYPRAIADFTEAIRLDPKLALAYRNRDLAHAALGEQAEAKADYEEAIRIDPSLTKFEFRTFRHR